jgi:hypothetical protein
MDGVRGYQGCGKREKTEKKGGRSRQRRWDVENSTAQWTFRQPLRENSLVDCDVSSFERHLIRPATQNRAILLNSGQRRVPAVEALAGCSYLHLYHSFTVYPRRVGTALRFQTQSQTLAGDSSEHVLLS